MNLIEIADALTAELSVLKFQSPITHVYNPLVYARKSHAQYVRKYGKKPREIILLGMNPGPWGMVQTGVPFGEVNFVRDWLGINATVGKPEHEHPKRPVMGFACTRSEVSGARLWGWARERFGEAKNFFARFFVLNYCPLAFMEESGRNFTPDKLPTEQRQAIQQICDRALQRSVAYLQPKWVVGIGAFAERRAQIALKDTDVSIGRILHPSPASPKANRDWTGAAMADFAKLGITL